MGAPFSATASELNDVSRFMQLLSAASNCTSVVVSSYSGLSVELPNGSSLEIRFDRESSAYVVADRVGS